MKIWYVNLLILNHHQIAKTTRIIFLKNPNSPARISPIKANHTYKQLHNPELTVQVHNRVPLQTLFQRKTFSALSAKVWAFPSVCDRVLFQVRFDVCRIWTLGTLESLVNVLKSFGWLPIGGGGCFSSSCKSK